MLRRLGVILTTTVITLLAWLFAESESLRGRSVMTDITISAEPTADRVLSVAPGQFWTGRADVSILGATRAIERVERRLREGVRLEPGMDGVPLDPGVRSILLRDAIRALPEVRDSGVTIGRVEPADVSVEVDTIREAEITVRIDAGDAEFDGPPVAQPPTVRLRAPARELDRLQAQGQEIAAVLRIEPSALRSLVPGRRETVPRSPLRLPPELAGLPGVKLDPPNAEAIVTLKSRTAQAELASVPVHVRLASSEVGRFDVIVRPDDQFIRNVKVSGPADLVALVRSGELKVAATLALSFEELERGITSKEVVFTDLPSPLRIEADGRLVRFTIRKREPQGG